MGSAPLFPQERDRLRTIAREGSRLTLAATLIAIFLIPVTYYVVERFAAKRQQRAPDGAPTSESRTAIGM